jgi:hypothetical protein
VKVKRKKILFNVLNSYVPWGLFASVIFNKEMSKKGFEIDFLVSDLHPDVKKELSIISDSFIVFNYVKTRLEFLLCLHKIIYYNILNIANYFDFDKLKKLYIGPIYVGDLIYDSYTKSEKSPSVSRISMKYFVAVNKAYLHYIYYTKLLNNLDYEYVIVNHNCYIRNGILVRMASLYGVKPILFSPTEAGLMMRKLYPTGYQYKFWSLLNPSLFNRCVSNKKIQEDAISYFDATISGKVKTLDSFNTDLARKENRDDLLDPIKEIIDANSGRKIVVIAAHCLTDNVTGAYGNAQVYFDILTWFKETVIACSNNSKIVTFVKLHPREYAFDYSPKVIDVFNELNINNVYIWHADVDLVKNYELLDAVITVRGSVSIELPCLGVPVITAGKGHAASSGFGTAIEVSDIEEYLQILSTLQELEKLSSDEILLAKIVYFLRFNSSFYSVGKQFIPSKKSVFRDDCVGLDPKMLPVNPLNKNATKVVQEKIELYEQSYGKRYSNDLSIFLGNDDIIRFGEVDFIEQYNLDLR